MNYKQGFQLLKVKKKTSTKPITDPQNKPVGTSTLITVLEKRIAQIVPSPVGRFCTWIVRKGMPAEHKSQQELLVEPALSQGAPKFFFLGQKCPSRGIAVPRKRTN